MTETQIVQLEDQKYCDSLRSKTSKEGAFQLSRRLLNVLRTQNITTREELVSRFKARSLHPGKTRNYGWVLHAELAKALGAAVEQKPRMIRKTAWKCPYCHALLPMQMTHHE